MTKIHDKPEEITEETAEGNNQIPVVSHEAPAHLFLRGGGLMGSHVNIHSWDNRKPNGDTLDDSFYASGSPLRGF